MKAGKFKNEKYIDFSKSTNKLKMEKAIYDVKKKLGKEYKIIIGDKRITLDDKFNSYNPSNKSEVIGVFQKANTSIAEKAIEEAQKSFEIWKFTPPIKRAEYLLKAAKIMRKRRYELDAWEILEVGKTWLEADADIAEAIDFLEFYAREMVRYSKPQPLVKYHGEKNELVYMPLGVGVIIPPWNFPMAILVGMTSAAFVCGNTVVLKPSSDSPLVAYKFMEILEEIKLPKGVVNFVTGSGAVVGDYLISHPKTRFISFTGSKDVGLNIVSKAGAHQQGQMWIKRVVAEMGGKDAIIVDREANLESASSGVLASAYGFSGQKCSACSRVIVDKKIYNKFLDKLVSKVKNIQVGPSENYENFMGPVINEKAFKSIMSYVEIGKSEGRLLNGGKPAYSEEGYFIEPTLIADVSPKARIAQEEIFGPVLAVIKARDFDNAIEIANDSEYGLTGAVYTRNKKKIEKAKKLFHVGNLYINRKCTGALVGVHPFGGFNMSGTDSKAGGRDYLLLFLQAKSISEKK